MSLVGLNKIVKTFLKFLVNFLTTEGNAPEPYTHPTIKHCKMAIFKKMQIPTLPLMQERRAVDISKTGKEIKTLFARQITRQLMLNNKLNKQLM